LVKGNQFSTIKRVKQMFREGGASRDHEKKGKSLNRKGDLICNLLDKRGETGYHQGEKGGGPQGGRGGSYFNKVLIHKTFEEERCV